MASRRELGKLEDENRTLCQRLSDVEVELGRKEDALKAATSRKTELIGDIREYQRKVKELSAQLEKSENAELEARGAAHDVRQELEHAETALRDQVASSKSTIGNLQIEIKKLKSRLSEKEEQYEGALEQLHHKEEAISSLRGERSKMDRDGSSRLANLNQALMQAKQACAQLTDENTTLKRHKSELLDGYKSLERKCETLMATIAAGCKVCLERRKHPTAPPKASPQPPVTPSKAPIKPVPEESEVDTLQIENTKLKREFQCLQTNFQLASTKSAQLKKDMKELEQTLDELRVAYDLVTEQRDDLQKQYDETKIALVNKSGSGAADRERCARMNEELSALRAQSDVLQQQCLDLQDKLKSEVARSLESQDTIEGLDAQIQTLKAEKALGEDELTSAREKLHGLEEQLSSYQQSEHCLSEAQKQSTEAIGAFEQKVAALKREKVSLEEQLSQASDSLDEVQLRVCSLEDSNKTLTDKVASLEAQNHLLTAQLQEKSGFQREATMQQQLATLSDEHQALSVRNTELEEAKERLELHAQEQTKTNARLQREVTHHWDLVKKLQKDLEDQEGCSFRAEAKLKESEQRCARSTQELTDLRLELETVVNAKQMYEIEVGKMMSKLEELEQCNFELSSKLADSESVTTSVKMSQSEASTKVDELQSKLGATRTTLVETELQVMDLRNTNELMERENGALLSQVNSLTDMVAARNTRIEALQSQLVRYESDSADIAARISDIEESHSHCASTKQELEWEIETLKNALEGAAAASKESEARVQAYKSELSELQDYNNSLESINSDLQEKIKAEIAKSEDLVMSSYDVEQSRQDLARESKMKTASLKSALDEVEFIKKSSEEAQEALRAEIERLEVRYSEIGDTCGMLQREKSDLSSQLTRAKSEVQELKHLNSTWKSENATLARRMERSHDEVSSTKDELLATHRELKQTHAELSHKKEEVVQLEKVCSSVRQELSRTTEQYDRLKESMLSLLDQSSGEATGPSEPTISTPTKRKLKGILKNGGAGAPVLKPVQNENKEN